MKYVIIAIVIFSTGCATTKTQQRRNKVLECTKELMDMDTGTNESYQVCKDLYSRQSGSQK
jgi:hypothetical protein